MATYEGHLLWLPNSANNHFTKAIFHRINFSGEDWTKIIRSSPRESSPLIPIPKNKEKSRDDLNEFLPSSSHPPLFEGNNLEFYVSLNPFGGAFSIVRGGTLSCEGRCSLNSINVGNNLEVQNHDKIPITTSMNNLGQSPSLPFNMGDQNYNTQMDGYPSAPSKERSLPSNSRGSSHEKLSKEEKEALCEKYTKELINTFVEDAVKDGLDLQKKLLIDKLLSLEGYGYTMDNIHSNILDF